jgi:hypothetical protein
MIVCNTVIVVGAGSDTDFGVRKTEIEEGMRLTLGNVPQVLEDKTMITFSTS